MDLRDPILTFEPTVPLDAASTPPASWYIAPAFDTLERAVVFRRSWQLACRAEEVSEPGRFVAGRSFGLPWVVLRDEAGRLRAFANVCRHKAAEMCRGTGRAEHLTCPYHGWTYRLDGSLRSAPRIAGIRDLDRGALALPELAVHRFGPLVLIHADPEAPPPRLDPLPGLFDATGWAGLRWHASRTYEVACNWKVFADNYLDGGYHIAHMHPSLADQLDLDGYTTEVFERCSVQRSPPALGVQRQGAGALYAWLYPNLMLNRYGPCLDSNLVLPVAADRCVVRFDYWFEEGVDPAFVARSLEQAHLTQLEDIDVSERVQVGMQSGTWERGRYAPQVEHGIHHFHQLLAADLRTAL